MTDVTGSSSIVVRRVALRLLTAVSNDDGSKWIPRTGANESSPYDSSLDTQGCLTLELAS